MSEVRSTAVPPVGEGLQEALKPVRKQGQAAPPTAGQSSPQGFSLIDASASLGGRNSMITDVMIGANNQVSGIRVIDSTTHQVIAESPPESIARMQEEVAAYQDVVRGNKLS